MRGQPGRAPPTGPQPARERGPPHARAGARIELTARRDGDDAVRRGRRRRARDPGGDGGPDLRPLRSRRRARRHRRRRRHRPRPGDRQRRRRVARRHVSRRPNPLGGALFRARIPIARARPSRPPQDSDPDHLEAL